MNELKLPYPNPKQEQFLLAKARHVGFGGARGGGKSFAVRLKAKLLALRYGGIRILILRRSYPELTNNHISILRNELGELARYNDRDKVLRFDNGSTIHFGYCDNDGDLSRMQGMEYDVIFIDEATQFSEFQMKTIAACVRGVNDFPKRVYYTCNPGGRGHSYIKRIFIDRRFEVGEDPSDYVFIQSLLSDNKALMHSQPDYKKNLEALPETLRRAWLEGKWDIFEGQFFEDFRLSPDPKRSAAIGLDPSDAAAQHRFTHVIKPFDLSLPAYDHWHYYRSYDFGYHKPFSMGYWAMDPDGVLYRIAEFYGCTVTPNEGMRLSPEEQFQRILSFEASHPFLKNRKFHDSVADPSIWDRSRGESIADTAARFGIYFTPGDNRRIPGWMQVHSRLRFDENGKASLYVFDTCRAFIRTIPEMMFSKSDPEDLDTALEDHVADEVRYLCMARPVKPILQKVEQLNFFNPLA